MEAKKNIRWGRIATIAGIACSVLLIIYFGLEIAYAIDLDTTRRTAYLFIAERIKDFAEGVIEFANPLAKIAVALFVLAWLAKRFSPNIDLSHFNWQEVQVEKLLLMVVTIGFVLLSLKGGVDSLLYLKEVLLVVLGLYFGANMAGVRKS